MGDRREHDRGSRATNEKPIKLPDDFEQTLKDLLATGPTPKDEKDAGEPGE